MSRADPILPEDEKWPSRVRHRTTKKAAVVNKESFLKSCFWEVPPPYLSFMSKPFGRGSGKKSMFFGV
jgi:hypothetical protein